MRDKVSGGCVKVCVCVCGPPASESVEAEGAVVSVRGEQWLLNESGRS